jgi:hypothetical protein
MAQVISIQAARVHHRRAQRRREKPPVTSPVLRIAGADTGLALVQRYIELYLKCRSDVARHNAERGGRRSAEETRAREALRLLEDGLPSIAGYLNRFVEEITCQPVEGSE